MSTSGGPPGSTSEEVTILTFAEKRDREEPLVILTAYDYPTARLADSAGVDAILVGDSLGMVVLGHEDTLAVTMEEMLHHAKAVRRGARRPLLIGDMPFLSFQTGVGDAVRNAGRFLQEAGLDAVKVEGGRRIEHQVRAIVQAGIPVMGHLGLTPQSVRALGGFRVQGDKASTAGQILEDALALEAAGCFALVLESVPHRLAGYLTDHLSIPTIGIGAGPRVSGQVLVMHDVLGLFEAFTPRFAKRYAELGRSARTALSEFVAEARGGRFPSAEHSYEMSAEAWEGFLHLAERSVASPSEGARDLPASAALGRE